MAIKRKCAALVAGVATISVLTGCGGATGSDGSAGENGSSEPTHISVSVAQANGIQGLMWTVGQEEGFFEDNGVIVDEVVPAEGGGTTIQNIISGKLPFGQVATSALVTAYNEGLPLRAIAGATQVPVEVGWSVAADSDFETVEDLQDAVWGFTGPGSVTEAMSYLVPLHAGLDMDHIERASTGGLGAGIALLQGGEVDVTFTTPLIELEHRDDLRVILHADEVIPAYQLTMLVSGREYAEKNPDVARGLLEGTRQAIDWIRDNPEEAGAMYAEAVQVDEADAIEILKGYIEADLWGLAYNEDALVAAAEGLAYTDGIESVDWNDILTDEFLPDDLKGTIPTE